MKVFAIPTLASGLTAAMSVLFFTGVSRVLGDDLLGRIILTQSAVALVVMGCVPQCWVYLLAAKGRAELVARYRLGFSAELFGFALGVLLVGLALTLPGADRWRGGLIIFASLAVQSSSSCLGWLRATESWWRYLLWVLGPNLLRVPLIWATPWLVSHRWLPDAQGAPAMAMALYFLLPDMVRWLAIAAPIALRHYKWPGFRNTAIAARQILQNWLFDVGSALTDVADKVVVGTLLGPQTLVAYFFARRLGIISTMVCEPLYAEKYRRVVLLTDPLARSDSQSTSFRHGLALALAMFIVMMATVVVATQVPPLAQMIPAAVIAMLPLFALVLLADCMLAANRWSRFLVQLNGGSSQLLVVRLAIFVLFALNVWWLGDLLAGLGLALAFGLSWFLEASYVQRLLYRARDLALKASAQPRT